MRLLVLIILVQTLISCDGPYKDCPQHYFSNDFKSYTFFNQGSYWIYFDSINNKYDSINLIFQSQYFSDDCDYNSEPHDAIDQHFYSSLFNGNNPFLSANASAYKQEYYGGLVLGKYQENVLHVDSLKVNNVCYRNVKHFSVGNNIYYWEKGVGLIKKVLLDASLTDTTYIFELIRYHLN